MGFQHIKNAIQTQFQEMTRSDLYQVDIDKDVLWNTYLGSFPPGTNPIYRERTEHDCSCCRHFIKTAGNLVSIVGNKLVTIWDGPISDETYQTVSNVMASLVRSQAIDNVFLHSERTVGTDKNFEDINGMVKTWEHFFLRLPHKNENPIVIDKDLIGRRQGEYRTTHDMFHRALSTITFESLHTVLDLINDNNLYRGEEHKFVVETFLNLGLEYIDAENKDLFVWSKLLTIPTSVSRIHSTVIGTLLIDLSEEMDLEAAVRSFEAKVAPQNFHRSTALVTQAMVNAARQTVEELGLTSALHRRHATISDININDIIFVDRDSSNLLKTDVFSQIPTKPRPLDLSRIESIHIEQFIQTIIPNITSLEIMFDNAHTNNLVSLIAPDDPLAKPLFKWDNRYSWAYNGDVTDSIKERVKKAGGNVTGDLCCRLSWFNYDDLDFHMVEPDNSHIYFGTKRETSRNGGRLDVDMNVAPETLEPVENIFYNSRKTMRDGIYHLFVNSYNKRNTDNIGFQAEIDFMGTVYKFSYDKVLRENENITVARLEYSREGGLKVLSSLPMSTVTKTIWGIDTSKFHKVNLLLMSPNYWRNQGVGNKHYFFMIDNCLSEGETRGFYNEYLNPKLIPHRKVLEILGNRMKIPPSDDQLSGLGFSSTLEKELVVKVTGNIARTLTITI